MSRIGLQQLSTSARNSPFGTEKSLFDGKKNVNVEPLKITKSLKKYQPITPSPLAKSPAVFNLSTAENKENAETQTVERHAISTQTNVTVRHVALPITPNDLCSDEPSANYLRVLADRLHEDLEEEKQRNARLVQELGDLDEKLQKIDDETEMLLEVIDDIEQEQNQADSGDGDDE
uniref:Geminin n=1 Tax=Caenorhabditis japonica TaxID=281687 RepID=A0A8R1DRE3_CAEJA